jgi:DNA helicase-2/ATP-dependent DNA helicase PcrA
MNQASNSSSKCTNCNGTGWRSLDPEEECPACDGRGYHDEVATVVAPGRTWSPFQLAVFEEIRSGQKNIVVKAVPGSGKTTTIVEAMKHVPNGRSVLAVAFNKSIAEEMKTRVPSGVTVLTLHSHGFRACGNAFNRGKVRLQMNANKGRDLSRAVAFDMMAPWARKREAVLLEEFASNNYRAPGPADKAKIKDQVGKEVREWADSVAKCTSLSKGYLADTDEKIDNVIDLHQIVPPERAEDRPMFIEQVIMALKACKDDTTAVDFDDMIWFPIVHGLAVPQFDEVFVDETQDLTPAQIALVLKSAKPAKPSGGGFGGRITAVGDDHQAIYQFAGSGDDSIDQVIAALGAKVLPLSITYRCSKAVVEVARTISDEIIAAPNAVEGSVNAASPDRMISEVREGDFILSRTNAPLMGYCLDLLKAGVRANIQGRDVGTKLTAVITRAKTDDVEKMLEWLDAMTAREVARMERRERDTTQLTDTQACIHALAEGETTVGAIVMKIEKLFADGDSKARVTLSTTHKAKGLERKRVWLLRDTYMRTRPGDDDAEISVAEQNLFYVAVTRAQEDLFMVVQART